MFSPKDTLSGDFYGVFRISPYEVLVSLGDCTGHGVSGAMLSILGMVLLDQVVRQQVQPEMILSEVSEKFSSMFENHDLELSNGMELGVCKINLATKEISFASSRLSLFYFLNGQLSELKPERSGIGIGLGTQRSGYSQTRISLDFGAQIFMATDGIKDQFNKSDTEKFGSTRFKELLIKITQFDFSEQKEVLVQTLNEWKGKNRQYDDITFLGIQI